MLDRLQRELAGEDILWAGQPGPRASFLHALPVWLFAVPWSAFSFTWEGLALTAFFAERGRDSAATVMAYVFPLFGLPFVLVGLGMLGLPFFAQWRARRTVHVLTAKRLITAVLGRETLKVTSIDPASIVEMKRTEKRDGSGNLTLTMGAVQRLVPGGYGGHALPVRVDEERKETLWGVLEVRALEAALLRLKG